MKKILLIGKIDSFYRELGQSLSEKYTVRYGSSGAKAALAILKRFEPMLLTLRADETSDELIAQLSAEYKAIPVIVIGEPLEAAKLSGLNIKAVIPAETAAVSDAAEKLLPVSEDEASEKRYLVMAVDDDATALRMVKAMLEDEFDMLLAASGEKALALLGRKRPDVILLDHEMPELSGIETLKRIRSIESCADIPVIFLSGNESDISEAQSSALNIAGYLIKPADAPDIKKALHKALKQ